MIEHELDPCATRTVKPRKPTKPCTRPIVAIDPSGQVVHEDGEIQTFHDYAETLHERERHIAVCFSPETWLYKLIKRWSDHPDWSWRVAVTNAHGRNLQQKRVAYYGFRDPARKHNRYHLVLDAGSFARKHDREARDLLALGIELRTFCNAHEIELRTSAAGIAAQLLKHPMFYPFPRRRVPNFLNEQVRPHLPGGYYDAYTDAGQRIEGATYIDQESAHHYAAMTTPLPNANSVRAIGYTRGPDRIYARKGTVLYERELTRHGLVKARVRVPWTPADVRRFAPPVMQKLGYRNAYIWTNELPYLESLGLEVLYLIAVWGTEEVDNGLAKYAQWASEVQRQHPQLKAMLLMPYGLLARRRGSVTYHHPGGNETLILANQRLDDTRAHTVNTQPDTANALQLGLIQAFVRALSLDMARQATAKGHEIVSIYADGIFVKLTDGKQLPMFAPWRVKEEGLELQLKESLRVPVRRRIRRDYLATDVKEIVTT